MNTNWIPKWVREYAKTVAVFIGTYVANAVVSLLTGSAPWPQNKDEWIQYATTTIGASVATWLARNKITQKQIDKDPNVVGTVYPDPVEPPTYTPSVPDQMGTEVPLPPYAPRQRRSSWR